MRPYTIGLLNELHDHFPDLLYRTERFSTVTSVLEYIVRIAQQDTFHQVRERADAQHAQEQRTQQERIRQARQGQLVQNIFQEFLGALLPQLQLEEAQEPAPTLLDQTLLIHAIQPSECAICQDRIQIGDSVRMIRFCTHGFHEACVDPWLRGHTTCPTCRHDLLES